MNRKIFVYLSCIVSGYSSTDYAVLDCCGMLGEHFPSWSDVFAGSEENLSAFGDNHSVPVTPREGFKALPSNVPTPKSSPQKEEDLLSISSFAFCVLSIPPVTLTSS